MKVSDTHLTVTELDDNLVSFDTNAEYIQTELGAVTFQNDSIYVISATSSKVVQIALPKRNLNVLN